MSSTTPKTPTPIFIAAPDSDSAVRSTIMGVVDERAKEYTNRILRYFIVAAGGATAAVIWNLNGLIYQAVGETSVSSKALEIEITRLRDEVSKLQKQSSIRDCLENKKVTDKAGCYRGN